MQVLFVSYAYPPMGAVGAMRVSRLCRYLPDYGIKPIVLTVKEPLADGSNSGIPFISHVPVERTGMLTTPLDLYRRWRTQVGSSQISATNSSRSVPARKSIFRRHLISLVQIPDMYWGWYWPAVWTANKLMEREQFSAILSSGPPWTCHLIARHIKKRHRLPWIADFRDAWTQDPWRSQEDRDAPQWRKNIDHRLESSCLRAADLVVCTTDAIRRSFVAANPGLHSSKFVTLTNGVDEDGIPYPTSRKPFGAKRLLLHLGSLYGGSRRIDTFCQAMADLVSAGKLDPTSLRVLFLGVESGISDITKMATRIAPELVKKGLLEFKPRISWSEGQQVMTQADTLLIFQGDHTLSVPAKFFEYLQTGKPILAVVNKGALSDMIEGTASGLWVEPEDSAKIAEKLLQILEWSPRSLEEIQGSIQPYQFRFLTEHLASWIRKLTAAVSV
jgi:glycosyltransferase involved in cell wall biosynthesis